MKKSTAITTVITTNCTIVESAANIETIKGIFDYFPSRFLPVVTGLRFVGVILREEFMRKFLLSQDHSLYAKDLISKEMVKLGPKNTLDDAREVFDAKVFDVIPVVDEEDDLIGIVLRKDVDAFFATQHQQKESSFGSSLRRIMAFLSL